MSDDDGDDDVQVSDVPLEHAYYVTYRYGDETRAIDITTQHPIRCFEDVELVARSVRKMRGLASTPVVLTWRRYEER